jgi:putative membrane protein
MHSYLEIIKQASISFPVIAVAFSVPYLIYNYKKYGSIMSLRIWIIYSFILYLLCTYCLIILPLPSPEKAQALQGHHMQLNPLNFIFDIIKHTHINFQDPKTFLTIFNNWAFLTTIFNIFMTLPFGFYLRYYFRNNFKQVVVKSFLLSLFFELTQLSGLYFIYAGNYRLFDVDDLITNTLGGVLGFTLANLLAKFLPTREEIDLKSYDRSKKISFLRRLVALVFDAVGTVAFLLIIAPVILKFLRIYFSLLSTLISVLLYLTLSTVIFRGYTFGFFMTNLKVKMVNENASTSVFNKALHYFIRYAAFFLQFVLVPAIPYFLIQILRFSDLIDDDATAALVIAHIISCFIYFLVLSIFIAIRKPLFYEKISKTELISTAKNHLDTKTEEEKVD